MSKNVLWSLLGQRLPSLSVVCRNLLSAVACSAVARSLRCSRCLQYYHLATTMTLAEILNQAALRQQHLIERLFS